MADPKVYPMPPAKEEKIYPMAGATDEFYNGPVLDQRAFQYHIALDQDSPGIETIKQDLASGNEVNHQDMLVANEMKKRTDAGRQLVKDNVEAGNTEDPQLIAALADPGPPPEKDGLVEGEYTKKITDMLMAAGDNDEVSRIYQENPMGLDPKWKGLEDVAWKNTIARSWKLRMESKRKEMGWAPYAQDVAMQLIWYPSYFNIVGNTKEGPQSTSYSSGRALAEKVEYVYSLPPVEMDKAVRAEVDALSATNPLDAEAFVDALLHHAGTDVDMMTLNDISILPVGAAAYLGKAAKAIAGEAKGAKAIAEATRAAREADMATSGLSDAIRSAKAADSLPPKVGDKLPDGTLVASVTKATVDGKEQVLVNGKPFLDLTPTETLDDPLTAELKATTRAAASTTDVETALSGTGKSRAASRYVLFSEMAEKAFPENRTIQRDFANMLKRIADNFNPKVKTNLGDNFHGNRLSAMETSLDLFVNEVKKVNNLLNVSRVPEEVYAKAVQLTDDWMVHQYPHLEDRVLNVATKLPGETNTGVGQRIWHVGAEGMVPFKTAEEASANIRWSGLDPSRSTVKNVGDGYAIEVWSNIGEDKVIDDLLTPENQMRNAKSGLFGTTVRGWLGSRMQTSDFQSSIRNTVVQSEAKMRQIVDSWYKPYKDLSYREQKALNKVMRNNQLEFAIPNDPTSRGTYYKTPEQLNRSYFRTTGRLPTKAETNAYFAMKFANDLHWVMSNKILYKLKASQGVERVTTSRMIEGGAIANTTFEGRRVFPKDFPLDANHNIDVVLIDQQGVVSKINMRNASKTERDALSSAIDSGYHIVQPWNKEDSKVLQLGSTENPVNFVITPDVKTSPLKLSDQVSYRPGWHTQYKSRYFLKQPQMRDGKYFGDTTIMGFDTEKQMRKWGPAMQKAVDLYHDGKMAELNAHIKASGLPFTIEKFTDTIMSRLDKGVPLSYVEHAKKTPDQEFVDGTKWAERFGHIDTESEKLYDISQGFVDPYVAKRDPVLWSVKNRGSENAPLYELAEASMVDPMATQTKAMGNLIHSEFYNDYQLSSANHWLKTFENNIYVGGKKIAPEDLRRAPIYYLRHGTVIGDARMQRQAKQTQDAIIQLVGQPSQLAEDIAYYRHKLVAPMVEKYLGEKYLEYIPDTAIGMVTNPVPYLRAIAFHTKLGLMNPVQFFVQGAAVSNVVAIDPKAGALSFVPSTLFRMARPTADEKILLELGAKAEKTTAGAWTKEMFVDSLKSYRKTGLDEIGSTALKDHDGDPKLFRSKIVGTMLDKGPMFFNAAEQAVRATAWNTAYYRYLKKFPQKLGKLNEYDLAKIKDETIAMSGNMTRDANAWWQNNSFTSLFTQFQGYNVRLMELMLGHQLSHSERIRLGLAQTTLWGMPYAAAGMYAAQTGDLGVLLPWSEDLQIHARNNGMNLDDSTINVIYRGLISSAYGWMTGDDYDFGDRYGMSAPRFLDNLHRNMTEYGDLSGLTMTYLGPSGPTIANIFGSMGDIYNSLNDLISQEGTQGDLLTRDASRLIDNFGGPKAILKLGLALYHGVTGSQMESRMPNGKLLDSDADPLHEAFRTLLGVEDVDVTDAYKVLAYERADSEAHKAVQKKAQQYMAEAMAAWSKGDVETADRYAASVKAYLEARHFNPTEIQSILWPGDKYNKEFSEAIFRDHMKKIDDIKAKMNWQDIINEKFGAQQ